MAILQSITDALATQDTAIAAVSAKIDELKATPPADPSSATVAEQQTIADAISAKTAALVGLVTP